MAAARPADDGRLRVVVIAEYYPSGADPVLGVWAHRQALAARDHGAEVRVLVLQRRVPPERVLRSLISMRPSLAPLREWRRALKSVPRLTELDGIPIEYIPLRAPPKRWSYGSWGVWAAPAVRRALKRLERTWQFDLIHAHYAVPGGQAALRARSGKPVVISVHGGDLLATPRRSGFARRAVGRALRGAALVLCNSTFSQRRCLELAGDGVRSRVVHLGTDPPAAKERIEKRPDPTLVTLAHLIPRKRHADVIRALADLPGVRYVVIGDGPELAPLRELARSLGLADRVEFRGQLEHGEALGELARCHVLAMPSVDEAFGVAYVEAMAAGLPAIGLRGEGGPEEIAACGEGMVLVPPRDPEALRQAITKLLEDRAYHDRLAAAARATAREHFTWDRCGADTVDAYRSAIRRSGATDHPRTPDEVATS